MIVYHYRKLNRASTTYAGLQSITGKQLHQPIPHNECGYKVSTEKTRTPMGCLALPPVISQSIPYEIAGAQTRRQKGCRERASLVSAAINSHRLLYCTYLAAKKELGTQPYTCLLRSKVPLDARPWKASNALGQWFPTWGSRPPRGLQTDFRGGGVAKTQGSHL